MKTSTVLRTFLSICILTLLSAASAKAATKTQMRDLYLRDGTNLPYALLELEQSCSDQEREARNEYLKVKRRYSRNLNSLDFDKDLIVDKLRAAQKKLNKDLRRIGKECQAQREAYISEARPRSSWVPQEETVKKPAKPAAKPAPKVAVTPQPRPQSKPIEKKPVTPKKLAQPKPQTEKMGLVKNFRLHGLLSQQTAYRISEPHEFTKNRSTLILEQTTRLNDELRFKFSERGFYDTAVAHKNDEGKEKDPFYVEDDLDSELELRDAYMDFSHGDFDMRLGKQQIVWGEAVSVFVADVVNGRDLREFILPEFDQIRLPQWSALVSQQHGDMHLEGVVSVPRFNKLPTENSEFAYRSTISTSIPTVSSPTVKPETSLSNADIGFRISYLFGGLDTGFFFLHTWDKTPVPFRTLRGSTLAFQPEYKRQDVFGMTFSKDVFDSIAKGELAIRPQTYAVTSDPMDFDGIKKLTSYEYILGVDQNWFTKWDLNLQIYQRFLSGHTSDLVNDDASTTLVSAWLRGRFFNDRFHPEYLIVSSTERRDRMHRPKITMRLTNWMQLKLGADFFEGKQSIGIFAPFDEKDRGYGELEIKF